MAAINKFKFLNQVCAGHMACARFLKLTYAECCRDDYNSLISQIILAKCPTIIQFIIQCIEHQIK